MKILPTLHILNGDASMPAFEAAALPGKVLVWREVLSEGPAVYTLPDDEFWKKRQQYITNNYAAPTSDYEAKVLQVVQKLQNAQSFFEVILWFDTDLMCQINLLYLLYLLDKNKVKLISICIPDEGENVGYLKPEQMRDVFENRKQLQPAQLEQATKLWQLYAGPDPMSLQAYLLQNDDRLPTLKKALYLHLKRFPDTQTSINYVQQVLLKLISNGCTDQRSLMEQFWKQEPDYGFGDLQLQHELSQLQPDLVSPAEPFILTDMGKRVLEGKQKYSRWLEDKPWLGGVQLTLDINWAYDSAKSQLIEYQKV